MTNPRVPVLCVYWRWGQIVGGALERIWIFKGLKIEFLGIQRTLFTDIIIILIHSRGILKLEKNNIFRCLIECFSHQGENDWRIQSNVNKKSWSYPVWVYVVWERFPHSLVKREDHNCVKWSILLAYLLHDMVLVAIILCLDLRDNFSYPFWMLFVSQPSALVDCEMLYTYSEDQCSTSIRTYSRLWNLEWGRYKIWN